MDRRFSVAPMMACTDRHERYLLRLISARTLLYTEMVTTGALLHGDPERFLGHDRREHPVALQLGGNDPGALAECARMGEAAGFEEINLNVGCPSDRVRSGCFGAALMAEPGIVAACVGAMRQAVAAPVTVKTRIGIDDRDSYRELLDFCRPVVDAGCQGLIVHARKAWLQGVRPRQNRELPPLRYDRVARLKTDLPGVPVVLNGGITTVGQVLEHLDTFDGVMMGRAAYHDPYLLAAVDAQVYAETAPVKTRRQIVAEYLPYVARQLERGVPLARMGKHLPGLFLGVRGARRWRRTLSEQMHRRGAGVAVIEQALAALGEAPAPRAA